MKKRCPNCAERIQGAAATCRFCGAVQPTDPTPPVVTRGRHPWRVLALILGVLVFAAIGSVLNMKDQARARTETATLYAQMEEAGVVVRLDAARGVAYVHAPLWSAFNVDEKRGMAYALAARCADYHVRVVDHQSGQELASYSDISGFTVK